ncbi:MAG: HAMP domain-containing histidine kinase [Actinobacteria bacterium]|nr:HAMP domain-containing histidine kinase [Actinomycetota bacterium]
MKLSLKNKIPLWLLVILMVSFVLYSALIYFVYEFNLKGPRYFEALKEHPGFDQSFIDKIKELNGSNEHRLIPLPLTILPPALFIRVFLTITGGVMVIIFITTSSGFLFFRRMLKQVDFITKNVEEINDKKLHIRLNLKGKDPISNMAKTFDNMLDQIEHSFKSQKQFIQNVSHELNTPLTIIKTKIDVLKQKKPINSSDYEETIDLVDSEVMRLSKITEELLVLSELEENGFKAEFVKVNFKSLLEKMLKLLDNQIYSQNLILETNFKGESDISGNRVQIEQLLFNLFDNAVKYSVPQSRLLINLLNSADKKNLIFEITNTTSLINKEDIPNIFERFYKTYNIAGKKGFGLGLSIVKKIVEVF